MAKEKINYHGMLHDSVNFRALIEAQAKTPSFLDSPKEYTPKASKNYGNKPKTRRLVLSYGKTKPEDKY